ncbi:hypothetical protein FGB62_94g070 [Gracilaria domingensis]|nr:hypothetical protein FGB62_94g070 [Gracilaria domingensis]
MVGYLSSKNRTILTAIPLPPSGFMNISNGYQKPGQYVFGQSRFVPDTSISNSGLISEQLDGAAEEIVLGILSIIMIMTITEVVLTILSCRRQNEEPENSDFALLAIKVDGLLHFNGKWMMPREHWLSSRRRQKEMMLSVFAVLLAILIFVLDMGAVILTQPNQYKSSQYAYNLRGSHPIGTALGLGKFLRRNVMERPCVTPVFSASNPFRNYSLSACHTLNLVKAHKKVTDSVSSVKIGSWFHKGGSDHLVSFGNASIEIKTRAVIYGAEGGTRRVLFPILHENYIGFTQYLHQVVIYSILEESCNAKHNTRTCEELIAEHRSVGAPVTKTIALWTTRTGKVKKEVHGLETTLTVGISKPWITVFKTIGPLMTAELIEEVHGRGLYSHISSEEEEDGIPGLVVKERRPLGVFGMFCGTLTLLLVLVVLKRVLQPVYLADRAWENFERTVLNKLELGRRSSSGSTSFGKEESSDAKLPMEQFSHQRSGTGSGGQRSCSLFPKTMRSGSKTKDRV